MIASTGRLAHVLICSSVMLLPPLRGAAQECTGGVVLRVRDEAGRALTDEEMKALRIESLNGRQLRLEQDWGDGQWSYMYRHSAAVPELTYDERVVDLRNPLVLGTASWLIPCGQLGDLVLSYRGKEMRLLLDLRRGHYEIESPPFQSGTFHLRGPLCPHPRDLSPGGRCLVSSHRWEGMDAEWVRHLVPVYVAGGPVSNRAACSSPKVRPITTRSEWDELWRSHPGVVRSNRPLEFDFGTQVMLVAYLPTRNLGLTLESVRVDKSGDLTFVPVREPPDPQSCSVVIVVIYRSGVRSIEGVPLPSGER